MSLQMHLPALDLSRPRRTLALALVVLAGLLAQAPPAGAATPAPTLGPAPIESDCLYWESDTQGCYFDIGFIDATISDHLLRVGQHFTVTSTGSTAFGPWSWYHPPNSRIISCTPSASGGPQGTGGVCEYEATTPTSGWYPGPESSHKNANWPGFFGAALHCCTIGTYIDGDYFAIAGSHIEGTVTDNDGDPVDGAQVFIRGFESDGDPIDVFATTDAGGYYHALLASGTYTLNGNFEGKPLCLKERTSTCVENTTASPDATVDFRRSGFAEIAGKVTNLRGEAVKNVLLTVQDKDGADVARGSTNPNGEYQIDLDDDGTYKVTPVLEEGLFDPESETVNAEIGEEVTADFQLYDALKVEIESGHVTEIAGDTWTAPYTSQGRFDLRVTVSNTAPSAVTVENLKAVNTYGVQVATDAFPPDLTGQIAMRYVSSGGNYPAELAPGQTFSYFLQPQAITPGLVALRAKFSGTVEIDDEDKEVSDTHDGRVLIEDPTVDEGDRFLSAVPATGLFLDETAGHLRDLQRKEALETYRALHKKLDPATEKLWFGSSKDLRITRAERALALYSGLAPEQVAIATPNRARELRGTKLDTVDQFALYGAARVEAERKLLGKWWDGTGGAVLRNLAFEARYWGQVGSAEGRAQISRDFALYNQHQAIDVGAGIQAFFANGEDTRRALGESISAVNGAVTNAGRESAIAEHRFNTKLTDHFASHEYKQAQEMLAERDGTRALVAVDLALGELLGAGVLKLGGKLLKGRGNGLFRAADTLQEAGHSNAADLARSTKLGDNAKAGLPTYFDDLPEEARVAIGLDQMRGKGGISGRDANIARSHVAQVNQEMVERFGPDAAGLEMALVGRPVNPFEAAGSFTKVEVVGVKSVNPVDMLLGAHPKSLGQPGIFDPRDPTTLPNWKNYSAADQYGLTERYGVRKTEFLERHGTAAPDSKMYDMKRAIGERTDITVKGQYESQTRVYSLELDSKTVKGGGYQPTEILGYKHLEINGEVLVSGKPRPIGVDFDKVGYIDRRTGNPLPAEIEDFVNDRMNQLGKQSALTQGYAEPFHGATLRRLSQSDLSADGFLKYGHYGLTQVPEKQARQIAEEAAALYNALYPDRKPITAADYLKKVHEFNTPSILVTSDDVIFGPLNFVDP